MENKNIELSVIVLCYRTEEQIIPFVDKLKNILVKLTDSWQLVLVGNYIENSNDKTKDIVLKLASNDNRIKAVAEPKKGMMGWDMRKGMEAAEGKYLCVIDGDGQFPIESIELCFRLIKEKNLDFVKTYREKREDGIYRIILSDVYNFVFGILFPNLNCKDANSKPKIITSEAYKKMTLSSDDWFLDAEIIINVRKLKLKFEEIPIHFSKIYSRESFVKFNAIFEFIKNLIRFRIKEFF